MAGFGLGMLRGTDFSIPADSGVGTAAVHVTGAKAGDKVLNVYLFSSQPNASSGTANVTVVDATADFGTNLVGDTPPNPPRLVCYNNAVAGGGNSNFFQNIIFFTVATTG
jgi:hypothetical protein